MSKINVIRPCVLLLFLLSSLHSYSQQDPDPDTARGIPKNLFLGEILGHGRGFGSANYERMFTFTNKHFLYSFRIGAGYTPGFTSSNNKRRQGVVSFPLVASLMAGGKLGYAQLSVGYSYSFGESYIDSTATPPHIFQKYEPAYTISFGYRFIGTGVTNITVAAFPMLMWTNNPSNRFSVGGGVFIGTRF
jgi:hypothetical protein